MNSVNLVGRMTKAAEVRYTQEQKAIATFTLAVDRGAKDKGADFIRCVAFGKTAEIIERYTDKGRQLAVSGHINTGSYEKDGRTVYTTDVIADRIFLIGSNKQADSNGAPDAPESAMPAGFEAIDDDIPF